MLRKRKREVEKKELLKKAYALGFEVGYYRHYEAVGWVRREREKIESLASRYGIEVEVRRAYERGKADGERKKSTDLLEEKEVHGGEKNLPVRGLEAISTPSREPRFFHLPKFLRRYRR